MKILGVGFNYQTHRDEAPNLCGSNTSGVKPELIIFHKGDSILRPGLPFFLPDWSQQIDYEAEIVVRISRVGKHIAERFAHRYYDELSIGIDLTARDLQERAIREGLPWSNAKAFDGSAVVGQWVHKSELNYPSEAISLRLDVSGQTVQQASSHEMLHSIDQIIAYISQWHTLKMGDIIFTGTPQGVGTCQIGQHIEGYLGERKLLDLHIK